MTDTVNEIKIYKPDSTKFKGIVYYSDFNTNFSGKRKPNGSTIADRIARDGRFDNYCRRNIEARDKRTPTSLLLLRK